MKRFKLSLGFVLFVSVLLVKASPLVAEETSKISVDVKVGTGLNGRDLVGEATSFDAATPQVVGWTLVKGAAEPTEIQHEWIYKGVVVSSVSLPVKSSFYRTFSRKSISNQVGSWELNIKSAAGELLAHSTFEVTSSSAPKP